MNPPSSLPTAVLSRVAYAQRGVALVLVLSFLVLTVTVVLLFFSSVTVERSSSASYAAQTTTQQLAESTVQLVMGTIKQATTPPSPSAHVGWASQPGMIRTYGDGSGNPATSTDLSLADYKLYSSDNTVVTLGQMPFDPSTEVPADWSTRPAFFTDLNRPITIQDPSVNAAVPIYPVVDPSAQSTDGQSGVEGFFINQAPLSTTDAAPNPAPMPVKWVYVLRDGTLTAPDSGSGSVAQWTTAAARTPSVTNPIVGRIAYWTDDETCKINLNTASEGSAWDVPRSASAQDINYALIQPLQHEYQRFPGHPATTSLSTVFNGLGLPLASSPFPAAPFSGNSQPSSHVNGAMTEAYTSMRPYYAFSPRVADGGSAAGTGAPSANPTPIPTKVDRLYASVDELLFKAPTTNNSARTAQSPLTKAELEKAKFFLTVGSRAPEVTLFDTPKLPPGRSGTTPTRASAPPSTSSSPFAPASAATVETILDLTNISSRVKIRAVPLRITISSMVAPCRATDSFTLIYKLSPAGQCRDLAGGNTGLAGKFAADRDQILTSIYDYIRSTNLGDVSTGATPYTPVINNIIDPNNTYGMSLPINRSMLGGGEVIPIRIGATQGFGRAATVAEAGIIFYATNPQPSKATPATNCSLARSSWPRSALPCRATLATYPTFPCRSPACRA